MGILFIAISAVSEAIWNIYLTKSKGLRDWLVNLLGLAFLSIGIVTFKKALNYMPLSIVIVIWSGLSLLFTIALDMYIYKTRIDLKLGFFMILSIISILGLNYFHKAR
jgi:multidrug transporter EmrE-like cation transporter